MHSSILRKETIKKFGYDPNKLSPRSSKRVVTKCLNCGLRRFPKLDSLRELCLACSYERQKKVLTKENYIPSKKEEILDICFSGSFQKGKTTSIIISHGRYKKSLCLTRIKTLSILRDLGLEDSADTSELKRAAAKALMVDPSVEGAFELMTLILNRKRTLVIKGNRATINGIQECPRKLIEFLLKKQGVDFYSKNGIIRIRTGSFFVDGRWIHVG